MTDNEGVVSTGPVLSAGLHPGDAYQLVGPGKTLPQPRTAAAPHRDLDRIPTFPLTPLVHAEQEEGSLKASITPLSSIFILNRTKPDL